MSNHQANKNVSIFTFSFRLIRLLMHVLTGVFLSSTVLAILKKPRKLDLIQWWSTKLMHIMCIQVQAGGHLPEANRAGLGTMFIANHISWVDIHALMSITPLRFIAKSEIRQWPVFGYLAAKANVLFIDRSKRHDAAKIVNVAVDSLNNQDQLCFFPEGTTTDGTHMLGFKGSLMQAPIDAQATIHPVAIYYPNADGSANINLAFAGETTMIESILTILKQQSSLVTLHFFEKIDVSLLDESLRDRRYLTQYTHRLIYQHLYGEHAPQTQSKNA